MRQTAAPQLWTSWDPALSSFWSPSLPGLGLLRAPHLTQERRRGYSPSRGKGSRGPQGRLCSGYDTPPQAFRLNYSTFLLHQALHPAHLGTTEAPPPLAAAATPGSAGRAGGWGHMTGTLPSPPLPLFPLGSPPPSPPFPRPSTAPSRRFLSAVGRGGAGESRAPAPGVGQARCAPAGVRFSSLRASRAPLPSGHARTPATAARAPLRALFWRGSRDRPSGSGGGVQGWAP